jgi:DNA-binding XRE family transcriptional regulator
MTPQDLVNLRHKFDITQERLAEMLKVHRITVHRWEKGHIPITERVENMVKSTLKVYGYNITWLRTALVVLSSFVHALLTL